MLMPNFRLGLTLVFWTVLSANFAAYADNATPGAETSAEEKCCEGVANWPAQDFLPNGSVQEFQLGTQPHNVMFEQGVSNVLLLRLPAPDSMGKKGLAEINFVWSAKDEHIPALVALVFDAQGQLLKTTPMFKHGETGWLGNGENLIITEGRNVLTLPWKSAQFLLLYTPAELIGRPHLLRFDTGLMVYKIRSAVSAQGRIFLEPTLRLKITPPRGRGRIG
jgi:hypothetical protein